jgi:hypothetical protein
MQPHKFLNKKHSFIHGKFQAPENRRRHARPFFFVAVKRPTLIFVVLLGNGFGYVVHDGRPAKPEIVRNLCHVVQHLQCVKKIVFVRLVADIFNAV